MQRNSVLAALFVLLSAACSVAQVLSPSEAPDLLGQRLQATHFKELKAMAEDLRALKFPYDFYYSRTLDVDEPQQKQMDQRSIQFVKHEGLSVLQITGNYYVAYPSETMGRQERARQTFNDVILPILKVEVAHFNNDESFGGYAFEIAYHVKHKVLGVDAEGNENLAIVLPRRAGEQLARAKSLEDEQAALLDGLTYLDAQPFLLWVGKETPSEDEQAQILKDSLQRQQESGDVELASAVPPGMRSDAPIVSENLVKMPDWMKPKPVTADDLGKFDVQYADLMGSIVRNLDSEAHFVSYAQPSFVAFRDAAFMQLSLTTTLDASDTGTQYKLAALAFDEHIAHLIRPVYKQIPSDAAFTGVDFSTTVKAANGKTESVEFFLPLTAMRCFSSYECSGQQIVSNSVVLINGERANVDLERAEAEAQH